MTARDGVATDLAPFRFTDRVAMKSSALPAVELIPEWDKAIESGHSGVRLIEMPLQANIFSLYVESVIKSGKLLYQKRAFMRRRLIVACRCCGETDVFVKHYPRPFVPLFPTTRHYDDGTVVSFYGCRVIRGEIVAMIPVVINPI